MKDKKDQSPLINIKNLSYSYGKKKVLQQLNAQITRGDFLGIIGPNGAGKSTLLNLMSAIIPLQEGDILVNNRSIATYNRKDFSKFIAYVPQQINLKFDFSVQEIVEMGRFPFQKDSFVAQHDAHQAVKAALEQLDLMELRHRSFLTLSGGEQQRTIIASALAQQPDIIFLDEPTSALDLHHQQEIFQILKRLSKQQKMTVVVVMHNINLSAQYCNRLLLLKCGAMVKAGSPDEVLQFSIIEQVYGVKVYIDINPFTGSLYILPYAMVES